MASKFDKMTDGNVEESEVEEYSPTVIFTNDAMPDMASIPISRLRLAQGMTPEVTERRATIGQYVLTNFAAVDEVEVVPLACQPFRQYKPDARAQALCVAPTGTFGRGNPGGPCNTCPLSKWGEKNPKTGKATPPKCKDGVVMRAYSLTHRTLIDFHFAGRNTGRGSFIMTQAFGYGYGKFVVRMRSSSAKNDLGQWFEPEIEMMGEVPAEHQEMTARWLEAVDSQKQNVSSVDLVDAIKEGRSLTDVIHKE